MQKKETVVVTARACVRACMHARAWVGRARSGTSRRGAAGREKKTHGGCLI